MKVACTAEAWLHIYHAHFGKHMTIDSYGAKGLPLESRGQEAHLHEMVLSDSFSVELAPEEQGPEWVQWFTAKF